MVAFIAAFIQAMAAVWNGDNFILPRSDVQRAAELLGDAVCSGVKQEGMRWNHHQRLCIGNDFRLKKILYVLGADADAGILFAAAFHKAVDVGDLFR